MSTERRRALFRQERERRAERERELSEAQLAETPVREVSMTELARRPARIVRAVREGELVVLSKHKRAVAMIVPLTDEPSLTALNVGCVDGVAPLADEFKRRAADRWWSALMHGRWYDKQYARYRRGRRR